MEILFSSFERRNKCTQFFIQANFCKNMGERRALFGQKYRQNSSFCDSVVFLCNRNGEKISEIERKKIFILKNLVFRNLRN